jgi:hypothetical protein
MRMSALIKRFVSSKFWANFVVMIRPIKKRRKLPSDPKLIFVHALKFMRAEEHLRNSQKPPTPDFEPIMILSAFASELFLKCIHAIAGTTASDTHRLNVLFRRLHNTRKNRITELWNISPAPEAMKNFNRDAKANESSELLPLLRGSGDAFERLRYAYESGGGTFLIPWLPRVLCQAILEIKPEWVSPR